MCRELAGLYGLRNNPVILSRSAHTMSYFTGSYDLTYPRDTEWENGDM